MKMTIVKMMAMMRMKMMMECNPSNTGSGWTMNENDDYENDGDDDARM